MSTRDDETSGATWDVTMLLCDAAQSVGGKLYIIGGGWSQLLRPETPTNMALAIKLGVPWSETNRPIKLRAELVTDQGSPVEINDQHVFSEGELQLGRPANLRPGTQLDAPLVIDFAGIALPPGGYVWQLLLDGEPRAKVPFRVLPEQGGTS